MDDANRLGGYLRARRELVTPEDAGVVVHGIRRVPGLRREEVAMLAGVSADYYLRLEQGRDRNPSTQVLEALALVLRLDADATDYLLSLVPDRSARTARAPRRQEVVPAGLRQLLDTIGLPAFVEGRFLDVLAANGLATALSPNLREGGNRLRDVFLDPAERELWSTPPQVLGRLVAGFRSSVGTAVDDPRCVALVEDLAARSEQFRRLWARQDVTVREGSPTTVVHPVVGPMTLLREKLAVTGADGLTLVLHHAEPGSPSADALALLGSLAAVSPARPR